MLGEDLAGRGALRAAVGARTLEQLVAEREALNVELAAAVAPAADRLGVTAGQVAVRDVMLPAELRRAAAEVVLARQRGLAGAGAGPGRGGGAALADEHRAAAG
jgi:regulator of protease activity HflC (stomatin/prohibitin superfamily)